MKAAETDPDREWATEPEPEARRDWFLFKVRKTLRLLTADLDDAVSSHVIIRVRRVRTDGAAGRKWRSVCDTLILLFLFLLLKLCHKDKRSSFMLLVREWSLIKFRQKRAALNLNLLTVKLSHTLFLLTASKLSPYLFTVPKILMTRGEPEAGVETTSIMFILQQRGKLSINTARLW